MAAICITQDIQEKTIMINSFEQIQPSRAARKHIATKRATLLVASAFAVCGFNASSPANADTPTTEQRAPVIWHAQSGNTGPVAEGAQATLQRTPYGKQAAMSRTSCLAFQLDGFACVAQDVRGTGRSSKKSV